MKIQNKRAFTIVELVIVIAVIAILASVLIPVFSSVIKKANESKEQQESVNEGKQNFADSMLGDESVPLEVTPSEPTRLDQPDEWLIHSDIIFTKSGDDKFKADLVIYLNRTDANEEAFDAIMSKVTSISYDYTIFSVDLNDYVTHGYDFWWIRTDNEFDVKIIELGDFNIGAHGFVVFRIRLNFGDQEIEILSNRAKSDGSYEAYYHADGKQVTWTDRELRYNKNATSLDDLGITSPEDNN